MSETAKNGELFLGDFSSSFNGKKCAVTGYLIADELACITLFEPITDFGFIDVREPFFSFIDGVVFGDFDVFGFRDGIEDDLIVIVPAVFIEFFGFDVIRDASEHAIVDLLSEHLFDLETDGLNGTRFDVAFGEIGGCGFAKFFEEAVIKELFVSGSFIFFDVFSDGIFEGIEGIDVIAAVFGEFVVEVGENASFNFVHFAGDDGIGVIDFSLKVDGVTDFGADELFFHIGVEVTFSDGDLTGTSDAEFGSGVVRGAECYEGDVAVLNDFSVFDGREDRVSFTAFFEFGIDVIVGDFDFRDGDFDAFVFRRGNDGFDFSIELADEAAVIGFGRHDIDVTDVKEVLDGSDGFAAAGLKALAASVFHDGGASFLTDKFCGDFASAETGKFQCFAGLLDELGLHFFNIFSGNGDDNFPDN